MRECAPNTVGKPAMSEAEIQAAVAAFIRSRGVTRCPTACAVPTQGRVGAADREALRRLASLREARLEECREAARRILVAY